MVKTTNYLTSIDEERKLVANQQEVRKLARQYEFYRDPSTPFSSLVIEVNKMNNEYRNIDIVAIGINSNDVALYEIKAALARWLEIINNKYAINTIKSLNYDLTIYINLCHEKHINPFNISEREFIDVCRNRIDEFKPATLSRWGNSISKFYEALKISNPMKDELVKSVFIKHRKEKGAAQRQAVGMTLDHLQSLFGILESSEQLADIRDLIVLSLMFECLMRRAELINIEIEHLYVEDDQPLLYIARSKTDQDGSDATYVPFSWRTQRIIQRWLHASDITDGYLIRGVTKYGTVRKNKASADIINKITKRASELLGMDINLSGHSGRVGGIQELVRSGSSNIAIQLNARLKTPAMVARYSRKLSGSTLPMADMLKNIK